MKAFALLSLLTMPLFNCESGTNKPIEQDNGEKQMSNNGSHATDAKQPSNDSSDYQKLLRDYPVVFKVDRKKFGFSEIATDSKVRYSEDKGVVWIYITSKTKRSIALRKSGDGFEWVHEQEIFVGPNKYDSVDGTFNEEIIITYEIIPISSSKINETTVAYKGNDESIYHVGMKLKLQDVADVLKKWGYR